MAEKKQTGAASGNQEHPISNNTAPGPSVPAEACKFMGFSEKDIKKAIDIYQQRHFGRDDYKGADLCQIIQDELDESGYVSSPGRPDSKASGLDVLEISDEVEGGQKEKAP